MIGVHQSHFVADIEAPIPGNCTQAAVASILELPLDAVPHFLLFLGAWDSALVAFLRQRDPHLEVWTSREEWAVGWREREVTVHPLDEAPSSGLFLASGPSPRGDWLHLVVWDAAEQTTAWDPHPEAGGLAGAPVELWRIVS